MLRSRDVSSSFHQHNARQAMPRHKDHRKFSSTADRSRVENSRRGLYRGGYRF